MKLDGYPLWEIAAAAGYASTGAASNAISEFLKQSPPEDIEQKRATERIRLERLLTELRLCSIVLGKLLAKTHVVVQHGKIVGRFAGWATDPETGRVLKDADEKPIATFEEVEDDEPSVRILAELRANIAEQRKISESLRRLDGLDKPVRIRIEDDESEIDQEIEDLVSELGRQTLPAPEGHEG